MSTKALLVSFVASFFICGPSQASVPAEVIRTFNTALEGNDPSAVIQTAGALIAAAVASPEDPNARGAALEAGTRLCRRNACDRALAAAPLMTGPGTEEGSESLANQLVAFARWTAGQTKANDKALMAALQAVAAETPTYLTIAAFDRYHLSKMQAKNQTEMGKVAELAANGTFRHRNGFRARP